MTRMVIWNLPTFCRFYGRVKPYNLNEGKFNEFTASKMEEDVDTHIIFDKSLEPMTFMNMLALSRGLFVVGYGNPVDCWGKTYFERLSIFGSPIDSLTLLTRSINSIYEGCSM